MTSKPSSSVSMETVTLSRSWSLSVLVQSNWDQTAHRDASTTRLAGHTKHGMGDDLDRVLSSAKIPTTILYLTSHSNNVGKR